MLSQTEFLALANWLNPSKSHHLLLTVLADRVFVPIVPNDDNRVNDGLQFCGRMLNKSTNEHECSVLEMLLGLAERMAYDLAGGEYEAPIEHFFWIFIQNLELDGHKNPRFRQGHADSESEYEAELEYFYREVHEILNRLIHRTYKSDGYGGIFPLRKPKKDQRRVEIWYQMSQYIIENFPI